MGTAFLERQLAGYLYERDLTCLRPLIDAGLDALPALLPELVRDQPMGALERVEDVLKEVLTRIFQGEIDVATAREVALFQQSLGFLFKYKSYGVKATTPLGYSVFLQNPGEGFSFQRHLAHKSEVFHILGATSGSYVFLCTYREWLANYSDIAFSRWLAGIPNPGFDSFRRLASPGDVFPVIEVGTVHSVIGCIIEEFATVSVDMVERLHDQNINRPIPPEFNRKSTIDRLRSVGLPPESRVFHEGEAEGHPLLARRVLGGLEVILHESSLRAAHYRFQPTDATLSQRDPTRATVLHIFEGKGELVLADNTQTRLRLPFSSSDLLMIPPAITYFLSVDTPVTCSEHRILPDDAFLPPKPPGQSAS